MDASGDAIQLSATLLAAARAPAWSGRALPPEILTLCAYEAVALGNLISEARTGSGLEGFQGRLEAVRVAARAVAIENGLESTLPAAVAADPVSRF